MMMMINAYVYFCIYEVLHKFVIFRQKITQTIRKLMEKGPAVLWNSAQILSYFKKKKN